MTDLNDWEPLPSEHLAAHPGEFVESGQPGMRAPADSWSEGPASPAEPSPAKPPRATTRPSVTRRSGKPLDPAAERALQRLKAKLQKARASRSLIAEVQRREEKQERRQRAGRAPQLAASGPVVVATPAVASLAVDYAQGHDGRDLREESPWFLDLPKGEQERLHRQWATERVRFSGVAAVRRRHLQRVIAHGALVSFVFAVLQVLLLGGFGYVPILTAAGAAAAGVAQVCRGDRFVFALAGGFAYAAVMLPVFLTNPYALTGVMLAAYGMGTVGMEEEMRRSGGFDVQ